jgi:hypothetical protein
MEANKKLTLYPTYKMSTVENLLKFIKSHGNACYYDEAKNKIFVQSEWVNVITNESGTDWDEVSPKLKDVRDLLGY